MKALSYEELKLAILQMSPNESGTFPIKEDMSRKALDLTRIDLDLPDRQYFFSMTSNEVEVDCRHK